MNESENKSSEFDPLAWLAIIVIVGIVIVLTLPRHHRIAPMSTPENNCTLNLMEINGAAQQFALEHHLTNGASIHYPNDLTPYIKLNNKGEIPGCPLGGIYSISKVGENPFCSLGSTVTPAHVLP